MQKLALARVIVLHQKSHNDDNNAIRTSLLLLAAQPGTCVIELWEEPRNPTTSTTVSDNTQTVTIGDDDGSRWWYIMRLAHVQGFRYWGLYLKNADYDNSIGPQMQHALQECGVAP